jgi:hypothetical protein
VAVAPIRPKRRIPHAFWSLSSSFHDFLSGESLISSFLYLQIVTPAGGFETDKLMLQFDTQWLDLSLSSLPLSLSLATEEKIETERGWIFDPTICEISIQCLNWSTPLPLMNRRGNSNRGSCAVRLGVFSDVGPTNASSVHVADTAIGCVEFSSSRFDWPSQWALLK